MSLSVIIRYYGSLGLEDAIAAMEKRHVGGRIKAGIEEEEQGEGEGELLPPHLLEEVKQFKGSARHVFCLGETEGAKDGSKVEGEAGM